MPSCAEGGVLGILPGLIGVIQATEAIKIILGKPDTLVGRLLLVNALKMRFRELRLRKDPACPICGPKRTITQLIDYQQFCGMPSVEAPAHVDATAEERQGWEIAPKELEQLLKNGQDVTVIDVREPHEWDICHIEGAKLVPLSEFTAHLHELNSADHLVLHCRSGARSWKALQLLREAGFTKVKNLKGGILAWAEDVDPTMPTY